MFSRGELITTAEQRLGGKYEIKVGEFSPTFILVPS